MVELLVTQALACDDGREEALSRHEKQNRVGELFFVKALLLRGKRAGDKDG